MPEDAGAPELLDPTLLEAVDLARQALLEVAPAAAIGEPAGHIVEDERTVSLLFECRLLGYPGWCWTVTLTRVDGEIAPTVLEAELMPGDRSLLAPDWVPWSERLAEYRAAQEAQRAAEAAARAEGAPSEDEGGAARLGNPEGDGDEADLDDADDLDEDDLDADDLDDDLVDHLDEAFDLDGVELGEGLDEDDISALEDGSASFEEEVDDPEDAEAETDDRDPYPPAESRGSERGVEAGEHDEGDQPGR